MVVENIEKNSIRAYRLRAHHLDKKVPLEDFLQAVGACGLQNSPPNAWETALYNRVENCSLPMLRQQLYQEKAIVQAWSYRGVPLVFPVEQSDVFLTALIPQEGEQPWIYTLGITGALAFLQMSFEELLPLVKKAVKHLDRHTVQSKELLDKTIADLVCPQLPEEKRTLWSAPSMYGSPDKQTVGEAAVSFLLRPCAHSSLVVFGERQNNSSSFTSFQNWTGKEPKTLEDAEKILVRKYLRCFAPATTNDFMKWMGCGGKQAKRLWNAVAPELQAVKVEGKIRYILAEEAQSLLTATFDSAKIILLGAHDPYLDLKDHTTVLEEKSLHPLVWKNVANPNIILKDGRIVGIWTSKMQNGKMALKFVHWEKLLPAEHKGIETLAEEYAAFRSASIKRLEVEER